MNLCRLVDCLWRRRLRHRHYPIVRVVVVVVVVSVTKWFYVHSAETVRDRPITTTVRNYYLTVAISFAILVKRKQQST